MFRSNAFRNFVVGAVFLGGLVLVGIVTLQVTGLPLVGRTMRLRVHFDQVSGLKIGDDVRWRGYRMGQVDDIQPVFGKEAQPKPAPGEPQGPPLPLVVTLRLNHEITLTRDTQFVIKSAGPLGGNFVDIIPGTGDVKAPDAEFRGTSHPELFDELGDLVRENRTAINEAITQIRDAVKAINEREGAIGALIRDPVLRDRVAAAISNLEAITRSIREGQGTVGKLINDPKIYNDLEDLVGRARRVMTDAEEGKGTLGMILKDEELARNLRDGIKDFQETIAKVNQGEGTVGQLVNNREAWDRLVFVFRQVQEAVEDFREQAPINTFVNAIFSSF